MHQKKENSSKPSASLEKMREQSERLYHASKDDWGETSAEETAKIFTASPVRRALMQSLDKRDQHTIVNVLEICISNRLTSIEHAGSPDFCVRKLIHWRNMALNLDVQITLTARQPVINMIRTNLIQPLQRQMEESGLDPETLKDHTDKLNYYAGLIRRLKFQKENLS